MEVLILATKDCNHRPLVEERLKKMGISYEVRYVDEHPKLVEKYEAHSSPNIIVDGEVVYRGDYGDPIPTEDELKSLFNA
ncbi:thioredoxin family protein [Fodinibius sp. AD559]|uniref:thioredoxin family protein n=1 Tax=Fodinibius sp. AD559 TaxID=3424179 RepID=UPI004046B2F3